MAAVTAEEVEDDISAALSWRRTEMHVLKSEVAALKPADAVAPLGRAMLRASVAMFYAHWEGFVKEVCQGYLDYVAKKRLRMDEVADPFLMLAIRSTAVGVTKRDPSAERSMLEMLRSGLSRRASLQKLDVVNTRGNLRFEVLAEILESLGLDSGGFSTKENLINRSLCNARNDIAHGRDSCPDRQSVLELHEQVLEMMVEVRTIVSNAVAMSSYRTP